MFFITLEKLSSRCIWRAKRGSQRFYRIDFAWRYMHTQSIDFLKNLKKVQSSSISLCRPLSNTFTAWWGTGLWGHEQVKCQPITFSVTRPRNHQHVDALRTGSHMYYAQSLTSKVQNSIINRKTHSNSGENKCIGQAYKAKYTESLGCRCAVLCRWGR